MSDYGGGDDYDRDGSPGYDVEEPEYDPAETDEPEESHPNDDIANSKNPDTLLAMNDRGVGVVVSGDQQAAGKGKAPKDKKIPKEERQTTPYMTKY